MTVTTATAASIKAKRDACLARMSRYLDHVERRGVTGRGIVAALEGFERQYTALDVAYRAARAAEERASNERTP